MCYTAKTLNCPSIISPDDENFPSGPSSMSRSFELFQVASIRMFQQHVRMPLVFNQLWDFLPKHRYGKTDATVRTMCVPVWTRSFIRQVVHSKFNHPDDCLHGLHAQASYMEIVFIRSTFQTIAVMVQTRQALIWKLRAAKVQSSGR